MTIKPPANVTAALPETVVAGPLNVNVPELEFTDIVPLFARLPVKVIGMAAKDSVLPLPIDKSPVIIQGDVIVAELTVNTTPDPPPLVPIDMLPFIVDCPVLVDGTDIVQVPEVLSKVRLPNVLPDQTTDGETVEEPRQTNVLFASKSCWVFGNGVV